MHDGGQIHGGLGVRISVLGAGYVGLVTAACLARLGNTVIAIDRDAHRIDQLRRGRLPFFEPGLDELIGEGIAAGRLSFEREAAATRGTDAVIVAVGTLDDAGEWSGEAVQRAVEQIAVDKAAPRMIAIRSTLMPGTTAALADTAHHLDPTVALAFNPEFTRQGTAVNDFMHPDRVVIGGVEEAAGSRLVALLRDLYAPLGAPVVVTDAATAELIKVGANVFLAMKIGFANEMARMAGALGADVNGVVDGIGLDGRIGRSFLSPGPGFGGSCLPSQSRALPRVGQAAGATTPILAAIAESNAAQADWVVDQLERSVGRLDGTCVALLGATFKAGTDDLRESPAISIAGALSRRGAALSLHDPMAAEAAARALQAAGVRAVAFSDPVSTCAGANAVVVATEWPEYRRIDWSAVAAGMRGSVLLDTRQVVDLDAALAAGLSVLVHGRAVVPARGNL